MCGSPVPEKRKYKQKKWKFCLVIYTCPFLLIVFLRKSLLLVLSYFPPFSFNLLFQFVPLVCFVYRISVWLFVFKGWYALEMISSLVFIFYKIHVLPSYVDVQPLVLLVLFWSSRFRSAFWFCFCVAALLIGFLCFVFILCSFAWQMG